MSNHAQETPVPQNPNDSEAGSSGRTGVQSNKPTRRWLVPTVVGVLSLILGYAIGATGETEPTATTAEPEPAPTVTVTAQPSGDQLEELEAREAGLDEREAVLDSLAGELEDRESAITETETEIAEGTIPGPGIYLVGEDIQPGDYRIDGDDCYWARLSGTSGDSDEIITNGFAEGPTVLTINESDHAFENGCGEWQLQ